MPWEPQAPPAGFRTLPGGPRTLPGSHPECPRAPQGPQFLTGETAVSPEISRGFSREKLGLLGCPGILDGFLGTSWGVWEPPEACWPALKLPRHPSDARCNLLVFLSIKMLKIKISPFFSAGKCDFLNVISLLALSRTIIILYTYIK